VPSSRDAVSKDNWNYPLEAELEKALQRAAEAEARVTEEACKVEQLSQDRELLKLRLVETETTLGQRVESAERALEERLASMDSVVQSVKATAQVPSAMFAERKQIVEDLRALKGDAENSLEQRFEAAERALAERLERLEDMVMSAQDRQASRNPADQELIDNLSRERDHLATQLQEALKKIEEQQRTIQEERATFWEELAFMRADRSNGSPAIQKSPIQGERLMNTAAPVVRRQSSPTRLRYKVAVASPANAGLIRSSLPSAYRSGYHS
jgi:hypothetical protein